MSKTGFLIPLLFCSCLLVLTGHTPLLAQNQVTVYPDTLTFPLKRHAIAYHMRPARKSVGLALSGGGANGMAQIGVLKALEEENIPIDAIVGTSIGAVVGGLYSTGYNAADLEKIALEVPWEELLSLDNDAPRASTFLEHQKIRDRATIAIRFENFKLVIPKSLSSAQKLTRVLDLLTMNSLYHPAGSFTTLPTSFKAVTTDLVSGKRITLFDGSLSEAMLASSTIPVIFEPIELGEHKLADGGLVANLAVDELENARLDYKIGVDTRGSMYTLAEDIDIPWQAADQTMTILIELQYPRQLEKADLVIAPDVGNNPAIDFSKLPEIISAGYKSGKALAPKIRQDISLPIRKKTALDPYKKSIRISGSGKKTLKNYHPAGEIIRNATYVEEALKGLLETDRFTKVYATIDRRAREIVFFCETPPSFDNVKLIDTVVPLEKNEIESCFSNLMLRDYTNEEGSEALEKLLKLFREKGYPLIDIERVDVQKETLCVWLSDGKISTLAVSQDKNITRPTPIMRELAIDTSKALRLEDIEHSIDNLFGTGAFNRVSIGISGKDSLSEPKSDNRTLRIRLNEKPSNVLRLGVRYDETYDAQAMIDFRNENLYGTANSIGGWGKIGENNSSANLEFNMPRIGATNLTFTTQLFYDQRNLDIRNVRYSKEFFFSDSEQQKKFSIQEFGVTSSFGTRIGKSSQLLLDMTVKNSQTFDKEREDFETQNIDIASASLEFALDTRDNSFLPTKGRHTNLRYTFTPEILNDQTFWQTHLEHEENISFSKQVSGQLGFSLGFSSEGLPFSEMFFLGGAGSPYSRRFIGLQENDLIGRNVASLGANFRYSPSFDIIFPSSFLLYYNAGNVWQNRSEMSTEDIIHGFGAGLNWETPLGPASFTAGKAFIFDDEENDDGDSGIRFAETVFYFNFGHEF
ncbi:BamA/TamA family outer membrane protein [Prosthecochloris sp.]|uniref:patatin-like phospholipase family protein n=1 Tax=Prosthecochloris sp. TaxID=290513 RepID=UPI0025D0062F|nr:BamA/TamA family outer membrane protein [Prosthecochloris sp.]